MKQTPYIGITGFTTTKELELVEKQVKDAGINESQYSLMAGIITSPKTFTMPRSRIRVDLDDLKQLTAAMPDSFIGAIHHHTHNIPKLEDELTQLLDYSNGTNLVQINNTWPSPKAMDNLQQKFPSLGYVLQFPPEAIATGPEEVAKRAKEYVGLANYTLVDPSQGAGIAFDPIFGAELMEAVSHSLPDAMMGIAGGLSGANVRQQVSSVAEFYRDPFVIDAEGRLRTDDWKDIDLKQSEAYLREAVKVMDKLITST